MDQLCSFGSGSLRSWTDVFTNHTFISPIDPLLGISDVLDGKLEDFALPHFLHEATHNTCLNSPVGLALAIVESDARQLAADGDPEAVRQAFLLHLRTRMVLNMYRPVFEGLALFAEYDAMPGHAQIATQPMLLALDLFAREKALARTTYEMDDDEVQAAVFGQLFHELSEIRLTSAIVDGKASVLSSPLRSNDGYLIGYLFVKAFAGRAAITAPYMEDSDLALGFAIQHFFLDYALVDLLLAPSGSGMDELAALIRAMVARLLALFTFEDLDAAARDYEATGLEWEASITPTVEVLLPPGAVDNDAAVVERAQTALVERFERLPEALQRELARRATLHLTSVPVDLTREEDYTIASYQGMPQLAVRLETDAPSGSLEIYYESVWRAQVLALSVGGTVVWQDVRGRMGDRYREQLQETVFERQLLVRTADEAVARFEATLAEHGMIEARQDVTAELIDHRNDVLEQLALPWLPESTRDTFLAATRRRGFRGLFDADDVRTLSVLSMIDGLGAYLEEVRFQVGSEDLVADCDRLRASFTERFGGVPLFLEPVVDDGVDRTRVRALM